MKTQQFFLDSVKTNVVSNGRGYFQVNVPNGVSKITLYSSDYGYIYTEYDNQKRLNFAFSEQETINEKEDTQVVIGYGEETIENISGNIDNLDLKKDNNAFLYNSIFDYIRGRIAGVKVTESNKIIIRGSSTLSGNEDPLFVVDGIIVFNIDNINPSDIDNISVLKGSNASIYGSRAANGVIEITTK